MIIYYCLYKYKPFCARLRAKRTDGIMAKSRRFQRNIIVGLVVAALAICSLAGGFLPKKVLATEHSEYYVEHKDAVVVIDADALYFSQLDIEGDTDNMEAIVEVANAVTEFESGYLKTDYLDEDWSKLTKIFRLCENYCKVKGETTDGDNYYANYSAFVARNLAKITEYKADADALVTKQQNFDEYVENRKDYITDIHDGLLRKTNASPDDTVKTAVDIYDAKAKEELGAILAEGKLALDACALDKADLPASRAAVDDVKAAYTEKLRNVPKNDVERAVVAVENYKSIANGDKEGDADAAYEAAKNAIAKAKSMLDGASPEVRKEYSAQAADFDAFLADKSAPVYPELADKATITDDKGVVTITAKAGGEEVALFPYGAKVEISDNSNSVYKVNAENTILKGKKDVSVAYCISLDIYNGSAVWKTPTEYEGKEVTYVVKVDLAKYYEECIKNKTSWLSERLRKIGIKRSSDEDRLSAINELVAKGTDVSLCYHYLGRGNVEAVGSSVENGTITFETKSFSNFLVMKAGGRSVLTNPIFWLIFLLALIVAFVVVVIVSKLIRYTITFYSNGGSRVESVKAKKDEYFVMPTNPTKRGYTFGGWFEDKDLNVRFVDTCMVKRRSFKVYAKWNDALSPEQADVYFGKLREMLATHGAIGDSFEIEKGATIRLAKLVKEEVEVKLYLALNAETVLRNKTYAVKAVVGENFVETPLLKTVDSYEAYLEAVELIGLLIDQYDLKEIPADLEGADETVYVLELTGEDVCEEAPVEKEEAVEEPEEPEEAEEAVDPEQLKNYFNEIRSYVKGFALEEDNDAVDKEATYVKVFLGEETVDVYLKADAEKIGAEKAEGALAEETPALVKVCCDGTLETAKAAIKAMMDEYGFVESGEEIDLGDSEAKSFGYKVKYED